MDNECKCGETHAVKSNIVIGEGVDPIRELKEILRAGHICVVCDRECDALLGDLRREYKVTVKRFPKGTEADIVNAEDILCVADDVRLYVAIGEDVVASLTRYAASIKNVPYVVYAQSPCGVEYFGNDVFLRDGDKLITDRADYAAAVILDKKIMRRAAGASIAAGVGELLAMGLQCFDGKIARLSDKGNCKYVYDRIEERVNKFFSEVTRESISEELTDALAEIGGYMQMIDISTDEGMKLGAYCLERSTDEGRYAGEHKFVLAYTIARLYSTYLSYDGIDLDTPADIVLSARRYAKITGLDVGYLLRRYRHVKCGDTMSRAYVIKEYREDLAEALAPLCARLSASAKLFRRLYPDAGYFLNSYIEESQLMELISVTAPYYGELSLLRNIKMQGALERYMYA